MSKKIILLILTLNTFILFSNNRESLDSEVNIWLNSEISNKEFIERIDKLKSKDNYLKALVDLYAGLAYLYEDDKENSLKRLTASQRFAKEEIKKRETSDLWRIVSEAGSYIMLQKGVSYIIRNSAKVNEDALKSIELNGNNNRAKLIVAQGYLNAPKLFGGDRKKGIELLKEVLESPEINKEDKYFTLITLAGAFKGKKQELYYLNEGLKIYPKNSRTLSKIEGLKLSRS